MDKIHEAAAALIKARFEFDWDEYVKFQVMMDRLSRALRGDKFPARTETEIIERLSDMNGTPTECIAEGLSGIWFMFTQLGDATLAETGSLIVDYLNKEDRSAGRPDNETRNNILRALAHE